MILESYKHMDLSEHAYLVCFSVKEAIRRASLQNTREITQAWFTSLLNTRSILAGVSQVCELAHVGAPYYHSWNGSQYAKQSISTEFRYDFFFMRTCWTKCYLNGKTPRKKYLSGESGMLDAYACWEGQWFLLFHQLESLFRGDE